MTFREQVADDFRAVFLNPDEFGRLCDWNGVPLLIVEGAQDDKTDQMAVGLDRNVRKVYCAAEDFPKPPLPGQEVSFDGEPWQIFDVQRLLGHLAIMLIRETSA